MDYIKKNWIEVSIFLVSLSVYSFTSSRSIIHGDTGEFLSVAAFHGVAHPPGFPLYSLVISLVFMISQNIWVVSLLSSFFGALTLFLVFRTVKLITKNIPASLIASLSLATYETFWFYSQVAQIHIFHVFVESVFLYTLILSIKTRKIKLLYLTFFLFGIGFTSHQAMFFVLPALFYVLYFFKKELNIKRLILLAAFSALGLFPYIYIAIAAATNPPVNWGMVHDFMSLLAVFFRADYGYFLLSKNEVGAPFIYSTFIYYFKNIFITSWFLLPFLFSALYGVYKRNIYLIVIFLCFIFTGPIFYFLMNVPVRTVIHRTVIEQYIPYSYIYLSVLFGLGAKAFINKFKMKQTLWLSLGIIAVFIIPAVITFQKVRLDDNFFVENTYKYMFSQIPKDGIILTWSDSLYMPGLYLQLIKKIRPDITIIQVGTVNLDWYPKYLKEFHPQFSKYVANRQFLYKKICADYAGAGKLYLYPWFSDFTDVFGKDCTIVPMGFANKVVSTKNIPKIEEVKKINDDMWKKYFSLIHLEKYKNRSSRTQEGLYYIGEQLNFVGLYYIFNNKDDWALGQFETAKNVSSDEVSALVSESAVLFKKGEFGKAINVLELAKKRNPAISDIYKNLGLIYERIGDYENTLLNLKTYLDFNPLDPQIPALQNKINIYDKKNSSSGINTLTQ